MSWDLSESVMNVRAARAAALSGHLASGTRSPRYLKMMQRPSK
jgi:hypothetical protein